VDAEQSKLLVEVSAGTPMGILLRSFWQPIAVADKLAPGQARGLRVMNEELTLFRGQSGRFYLVGGRCAHRGTVLHTGWVQGEQIRCMYHGWRYAGTGQCTEMPAETHPRPELVKIAGYPLHEYCGVLFAYMGEGPAPSFELPRKDSLEEPGCFILHQEQVWDCHWFQQIENSLDAAHVSYVHMWGKLGRFGEEITAASPELSYEETSAGIRQIARRPGNNVRVSDWTFPNNNHIVSAGLVKGEPWFHTSVWAVPIDERNTRRFTIVAIPPTAAATAELMAAEMANNYDPSQHYDELFDRHHVPKQGEGYGLTSTQDYVALRGQGAIADRGAERLGRTDAGIALLRKIFLRELAAIRAGKPPKPWRKLQEAPDMPSPPAAQSAAR